MISYIGGKSKISKWIIPHIPTNIETYVEPFGGMFWVFFNLDLTKYPNLKEVVYNDFNSLNTNLFNCVKQYDELYDRLSVLPIQKKGVVEDPTPYINLFKEYQQELFSPDLIITEENRMDIAVKYVYVLSQIYSGARPNTATFMYYKGKYQSKVISFMNKLKSKKFRKQFDSITFTENLDYNDVIDKYDSPTTYFYIDPPYHKKEKYYSNHQFGIQQHICLANKIKTIKGHFSLSYYEFEELNVWFPKDEYGWSTKEFSKASAAKKGAKQNQATELLIYNF